MSAHADLFVPLRLHACYNCAQCCLKHQSQIRQNNMQNCLNKYSHCDIIVAY